MVHEVLYELLKNKIGVGEEIYPVVVDESATYPAVRTVQTGDVDTESYKDSVSHYDWYTFQIDAFADSFKAAKDVAQNVRDEIDGLQDIHVQGVDIDKINFQNSDDDYDHDSEKYMVITEYSIGVKNK